MTPSPLPRPAVALESLSLRSPAALVSAIPIPDPTKQTGRAILEGEPPSPANPPSGCRFRTRCPAATEKCAAEEPQLTEVSLGHFVACHHPR